MQARKFLLELSLTTIATAIIVVVFNQWPVFAASSTFSWISLFFFVSLTILIFIVGNRAIRQKNVNALSQLVLGLVFVKLLACLMMIFLYKKFSTPSDHLFALPFLVIYLIYTIYEVVLLSRQNRAAAQ